MASLSELSLPRIELPNVDSGAELTADLFIFRGSFSKGRFMVPLQKSLSRGSGGVHAGICNCHKHRSGQRVGHGTAMSNTDQDLFQAPAGKAGLKGQEAQNVSLSDLKLKWFQGKRSYLLFI